MKAKYRFVGKYLKMNAFLKNNTKCTLAQVQPYNATFTVILLSWPKNLEYFFISHESIRWPFCHWSPFVVSRRPSWVWTSTWKLQVNCLKTLLLYYRIWKKSNGIVMITIKHSPKILKFMAHIIRVRTWVRAIFAVWWKCT